VIGQAVWSKDVLKEMAGEKRKSSVVLAGTKWASLVKRSTITRIASKVDEPFDELGKGPM